MSDTAPLADNVHEALAQAIRLFPARISANVQAAIRHDGDPVALQYLPDPREIIITDNERSDPIGDYAHSPVKGIVHRHPDRALFKVASVCAVNCRFCFRKTMLGTPEETLSQSETAAALDYIEQTPSLWEVILTGGDPLVLSPRRLAGIIERLEAIKHIRIIRIHTRTPIAAPERLTPALYKALESQKPLYIVLHINHLQEITPAVEATLTRLHKAGAVLLSQSVLLKGVNDNADALESLFRGLAERRVKPYYLHHPDMVPGTGHFRIPIATGRALMRTLRSRASGITLPAYVLDIPGGYGKIPLEGPWTEEGDNGITVIDHAGRNHPYE